MIAMPLPPKFLASGIGLSGSRMMSRLLKNKVQDLPAITVYCPEDPDLEAFKLDAELRSMEWLDDEIPNLSLLFLTADFGDRGTFDIFPDVMTKATEHGIFVFVFPINGPVRGKLGFSAATNDRIFIVEPVEHQSASQDEIVANGIKVITDITFVPHMIGVDYDDIKHILKTCPGYSVLAQGQGDSCVAAFEDAIGCFRESGIDLQKATGLIVGLAVGELPPIHSVNTGFEVLQFAADGDANIIWGMVDDPSLGSKVRVSVFAFGFHSRRVTES